MSVTLWNWFWIVLFSFLFRLYMNNRQTFHVYYNFLLLFIFRDLFFLQALSSCLYYILFKKKH